MKLTVDNWLGNKANLSSIDNPTWEDVEQSIKSLNNRTKTEVLLEANGDMAIGGGDGYFFVSLFTDDERNFVLKNKDEGMQKIELTVGGQRVEFPSNKVIDLETVLCAVKVFFESGSIDDKVDWTEDL